MRHILSKDYCTRFPKFYNKQRWLTAYALTCGYVETAEGNNNKSIRIYLHKEHNVYHVKVYFKTFTDTHWLSFKNLTEARKQFSKFIRKY